MDKQALIDTQILLEVEYGDTGVLDIIREEIDTEWFEPMVKTIEDYKQLYEIKSSSKDIATAITIAVLKNEILTIQELMAYLVPTVGIENIDNILDIIVLCSGELYNIISRYKQPEVIESNYLLDPEIIELLNNKKYLLPMVIPPINWTNNTDGGWLTHRKHLILGNKFNKHYKPQAIDFINLIQKIEWQLDEEMLQYPEEPNNPLEGNPNKVQQFQDMKQASKVAYQEIVDLGNKFYFPWRFDKRGRSYSQGYQINLQSTSYKKSILNFSKKEIITGEL